jgi:hypothetical protein
MNPLLLLRVGAAAVAALSLPAQACYHQGSVPVAASWQAAPGSLGCAAAPQWPAWHTFTPAHRAPSPHAGHRPGDASALPRLLITWRCTGFLLVPVVPVGVTTMGYVIDRAVSACDPVTS